MNSKLINWLIFGVTSLIWGSSFILMKLGLYDASQKPTLSAVQVASLRIFSAGLILSPFLLKDYKSVPLSKFPALALSGLLGIFMPAFLFCLAETRINSTLAGTINALTPLFVILSGIFIFKSKVPFRQALGIALGFTGTLLLFLTSRTADGVNLGYTFLVVIATLSYGLNANLVRHSLAGVPSLMIAAFSFGFFAIPSLVILTLSGYFALPITRHSYLVSTLASCFLGIVGSALAWFLFYVLIKRTSALFASSATYAIPFVALGWGWIYGEKTTVLQLVCLLIILFGVYLTRPQIAKSVSANDV